MKTAASDRPLIFVLFGARGAGRWRDESPPVGVAVLPRCSIHLRALRVPRRLVLDPRALKPFEGLSLLDIGCGGGLLSEPMARLGFAVTGADASERNIGTASAHAAQSGLAIDYRATTAEALAAEGRQFDVVLNMEVIEHVADPQRYLRDCNRLVAPGGMKVVATLNRTL